jgi:hypothetical protein
MIWTLEILVSLLFFSNKVFVLVGRKKIGWIFGVFAASFGVLYFYLIEFYVYTALEFGLIALMGYGFLKKDASSPLVENGIRLITAFVMIVLCFFAYSGVLTAVELGSSLGLLIGTYRLTHGKIVTGWAFYVLAHLLAAYLGYSKGQIFFADLQVASMIVSIVGVMNTLEREVSS